MKLISFTYPGLESILKQELEKRKIEVLEIGAGFVIFKGDKNTIVKTNLHLRTANKVYIILEEKHIEDFDKLFDLVSKIDWKYFIPENFKVNIKVHSIKSKLSHIPSIQSVAQKAIYNQLGNGKYYNFNENKQIEIRIDIFKNNLKVILDTSGEPLYKRGYKEENSLAGIKPTLASGLLLLTNCKENKFFDFFCGSGTILIEKAFIDMNIATGINRSFLFEDFSWIEKDILEKEKWRANTRVKEKNVNYFGYDIDKNMIEIAKKNIKNAKLEKYIKIEQKDFLNLDNINGNFVTNPPYDKRLKLENINKIYENLFDFLKNANCGGIISGYENINKKFFDNFKVRILSNGGEKVNFFYKKNKQ